MVDIMACNCIRKDKEGRYNVISYKKVRSTSDKSKQVNLISHVSKTFGSYHMLSLIHI